MSAEKIDDEFIKKEEEIISANVVIIVKSLLSPTGKAYNRKMINVSKRKTFSREGISNRETFILFSEYKNALLLTY